MYARFKHTKKIVGGFVIFSMIAAAALILIVARGQRWFTKFVPYKCVFAVGKGVKAGSDVLVQGLSAGKVVSYKLGADNRVSFDIEIEDRYAKRIDENARSALVQSLIGSSTLEIELSSSPGTQLPPGSFIQPKPEEQAGLDALIASATALIDGFRDPNGNVQQSVAAVNSMLQKIKNDLLKNGSVMPTLVGQSSYKSLTSSLHSLAEMMKQMNSVSPEMRDSIIEARRAVEEVNVVLEAAEKSIFLRGSVEKLEKAPATGKAEIR